MKPVPLRRITISIRGDPNGVTHGQAHNYRVHVCAYAVMSNHYHLVVKLDPDESAAWSDDEVLDRWTALFKGPLLIQRYRDGDPSLVQAEIDTVRDIAAVYRSRLGSLSWFMKCLNEPIARQANAEDDCTGHFWEARFHSQALLSESALMAAMAYVDLNPIRASMADTPEDSDYTSIKARISVNSGSSGNQELRQAITQMIRTGELHRFDRPLRPLLPFSDQDRANGLPMKERDYLQLVDDTGRVVHPNKRGFIHPSTEPILERLGLSPDEWVHASADFRHHYHRGKLRLKNTA